MGVVTRKPTLKTFSKALDFILPGSHQIGRNNETQAGLLTHSQEGRAWGNS